MIPKKEQFEIARQLATLPEDTDSRGWPEVKEILYNLNEPRVWSEICCFAMGMTENQILKIWLRLEHVNGWRRQTGKWDMRVAVSTLGDIEQKIGELPDDHPRKDRLLGLWAYHSALVSHANGDFSVAAERHMTTAHLAKKVGDYLDELLSLYLVAVERLNAAICSAVYHDEEIGMYHFEYIDATEALLSELSKSRAEFNIRWEANVLCQKIFYAWVLGGTFPVGNDIDFLNKLPESLKPAVADAAVVLRVLYSGNSEKAEKIASQAVLTAEVEWYSWVQVVRFCALMKMQKKAEAKIVLKELKSFLCDKHGGHIALAIINNELSLE